MKLQRKYQHNLIKIIGLLAIPFVIGLFLMINYFTRNEVQELLEFQTKKITIALENGIEVKSIPPTILISKIDPVPEVSIYEKVPVYDEVDDETEEYFELRTIANIQNTYYQIRVRSTAVERIDLFLSIFFSTIALIILLGFVFYWVNNKLFTALFRPFHHTLEHLNNFSISEGNTIPYASSDIDEFDQLSKVTSTLSQKVKTDYQNLKQFTENASHEIQTPLAIIRNKVEKIINDKNFPPEISHSVNDINDAVTKLSTINRGLLLLAKIDNKQFKKAEKIDFGALIVQEKRTFEELFYDGTIAVEIEEKSRFIYNMNPVLAEILIRNLMKNMLTNSTINTIGRISIDSRSIAFINKGNSVIKHKEHLFTRFYKESHNEGSVGLGLAIVKTICDQNNLNVNYDFKDEEHWFTIEVI